MRVCCILKACDWRTALEPEARPPGDWNRPAPTLLGPTSAGERSFVLPPGWMKSYPATRHAADCPRGACLRASGTARSDRPRPLALAISYPHYLYLRDLLRPDAVIYYNMDDYALLLVRPAARSMRQAGASGGPRSRTCPIFCAKIRADGPFEGRPAGRSPGQASSTCPHGAPSIRRSLDGPTGPPRRRARRRNSRTFPSPLLGFVGTLEDRLDWPLLGAGRAMSFPNGSDRPNRPRAGVRRTRSRLVCANIRRRLPGRTCIGSGGVTQAEIAPLQRGVRRLHDPLSRRPSVQPRLACPTKVMDYMATSRPGRLDGDSGMSACTTSFSRSPRTTTTFVPERDPPTSSRQGSDDGRARHVVGRPRSIVHLGVDGGRVLLRPLPRRARSAQRHGLNASFGRRSRHSSERVPCATAFSRLGRRRGWLTVRDAWRGGEPRVASLMLSTAMVAKARDQQHRHDSDQADAPRHGWGCKISVKTRTNTATAR